MMECSSRTIPNEILLPEVCRLLSEGRDVVLLTKGCSMLPFIHGSKDSVLLKKTVPVKVGDIVLAEIAPKHYVLHRVFTLDGENVTLMGDGNLKGTEHCTLKDIYGTVMEIRRPDGSVRKPTDGRIWRKLLPFRRIILGIYRRII